MQDIDKLSKNKTENERVNLVPIEADEIVIDCRGLNTRVLIDGREIYLEYFKVELDINGHFTGKATGFRPRIALGIKGRKLKFLQKEDGIRYRGAITEAAIIEGNDGLFTIEYTTDDPGVSAPTEMTIGPEDSSYIGTEE